MGVGPSTKETSLHHFRDPVLAVLDGDKDVQLTGIIVAGTPQDNKMKHFVGNRTAALIESMGASGAIISADGWGNTDVDFANVMEEIGSRDISVVGLKFIGTQAKFVVENVFTEFVVDINKSAAGIETEVVGENNVDALDARKALAFLKLKMRQNSRNA
ncbi:glycine/sarcosine/betaine reductase component B subunit [Listeria ilorinensis]|uniref:glycine/sarcosine/betaine reductase component B subunit n=1 Tax=Listeria ilorinensis TaxID=2867439 RepID=UPI001EF69A47|nr:glycine/sarcosine/betaine reductase component B subunit [Listeria ilorinensis]